MLVAGSTPDAWELSGGERFSRCGLALLGAVLCAGPPVAAASLGWTAAALMPLVPIGALFVILGAFYHRIAGEIRFATVRLTIKPHRTASLYYREDAATAPPEVAAEASGLPEALGGA